MKLVTLAREAVRILKESGDEGIRSDEIAEMLDVPKRRIYDVVAVLRALETVQTKRKFDGTTITWIDRFEHYVRRSEFDEVRENLDDALGSKRELQVQVAEQKQQLRNIRSRFKQDSVPVEKSDKTHFNTTQLRVRCNSGSSFKRVVDSGVEVLIETEEPGLTVDPTEAESDDCREILRSIQRT
ncbi:hypothetical protein EU538_01600 [Candidatus Thorarchaeota archaeon]|nr:MAG: hypothetical protein EU538_01600 [Candidatus Thorarchaeota archaeon]